MSLELLSTKNAPEAVGPYSQGVKAGELVFTSGQLPVNPKTGELLTGDIKEQTRMCLENIKAVLESGDASLENIIKINVYVVDIKQFSLINEAYAEYFTDHKPARSLVEVSGLPLGGEIEIEAIAMK